MHPTLHRQRAPRPTRQASPPCDISAQLLDDCEMSAEERDLMLRLASSWTRPADIVAVAAGPRVPLGELLVTAGRLSQDELASALDRQRLTGQKLGAILVRRGTLRADELALLLAFQQRQRAVGGDTAGPLQLGSLLVALGVVTPERLAEALGRQGEVASPLGENLVRAGHVTPRQLAHGLRFQKAMIRLALAMLLAVATPYALAAGSAHSAIVFSATVLPYLRVDVVSQAATLTVTEADAVRGYVDVPAGTALRAVANDRQGFTIRFDPRLRLFERVTVAGLERSVELGPNGGSARHAYAGRDVALRLSYRFYLAAGIAPGQYPWPLQISSSVQY